MFKVKMKKTGKVYKVYAITHDDKRAYRQINRELTRLTLFLIYDEEEKRFSEVPFYEFEPVEDDK